MTRAHGEASNVAAEQGEVVVDGPDGTAHSFTPDAAETTATRLHRSAQEAREQLAGKAGDAGSGPGKNAGP